MRKLIAHISYNLHDNILPLFGFITYTSHCITHRTIDRCICCIKSIIDEKLIKNVLRLSILFYLFVGGLDDSNTEQIFLIDTSIKHFLYVDRYYLVTSRKLYIFDILSR